MQTGAGAQIIQIRAQQSASSGSTELRQNGGYLLAPMIVFVTQGDWDWLAQSVAEDLQTAAAVARLLPAAPVASPPHPPSPPCTGQVPEQIANTWHLQAAGPPRPALVGRRP